MQPERINDNATLVKPLTRRGYGPGMIILVPDDQRESPIEIENGIPSLRMKWAEEGYCVVEVRGDSAHATLEAAV
jgi:carboxymethylenebutenolidase